MDEPIEIGKIVLVECNGFSAYGNVANYDISDGTYLVRFNNSYDDTWFPSYCVRLYEAGAW